MKMNLKYPRLSVCQFDDFLAYFTLAYFTVIDLTVISEDGHCLLEQSFKPPCQVTLDV